MEKTRRVIVIMFSIIYLILIILRVNIPRVLYIFLGAILLVNQAIDEWNKYLQTKKKFYLVIPIISVIILIFVIFQCMHLCVPLRESLNKLFSTLNHPFKIS